MQDAHAQLEADIAVLEDLPVFVAYNANVDAIVRVDEDLESFLDRPSDPGWTFPESAEVETRARGGDRTHNGGRPGRRDRDDRFVRDDPRVRTPRTASRWAARRGS